MFGDDLTDKTPISPKNKIIFLDIDGVLNNFDSHNEDREIINDLMVQRLKEIVSASGADIILTSSWRIFYHHWQDIENQQISEHYKKLLQSLEKYGLFISSITDKLTYGADARPLEILEWLKQHPNVVSYVILDDSAWNWKSLSNNVVTTRRKDIKSENGWRSGLEDEDVAKAISILNQAEF